MNIYWIINLHKKHICVESQAKMAEEKSFRMWGKKKQSKEKKKEGETFQARQISSKTTPEK